MATEMGWLFLDPMVGSLFLFHVILLVGSFACALEYGGGAKEC